jgi:Dioxygenase
MNATIRVARGAATRPIVIAPATQSFPPADAGGASDTPRHVRKPGGLLVLSLVVAAVAVAGALAAQAPARPSAAACPPTPPDAFGPFGRGTPPLRAKIGTGHVLTGVILSSGTCRPIPGAPVELWQSNRRGQYTRAGSATVIADRSGRFRFEGPFPASYEGREPHIHLRVIAKGHLPLLARFVPARGERRGSIRLVLQPDEV